MDIGDWLRELGLGQYEAAFRDNAVDGATLPKLTAEDLKEIGVVAVGHRRRLLDAIAGLGLSGDGSPALPASRPIAPAAPPASAATASAERRPITVMFCDLVGSTSLAAKLDPEDWRSLVGSYLDAASAAVTALGGHVLKKLGDGLMALFGYPQAQENDGERAVRAALAIQRALADLNARNAATGAPELSARIGLDSGRVVVDSTGEVFGDAPNVAARVQSAASPGEIWITRAVHRQIAGLFVAEDKGEHELKGVPETTQLYRIVRVSGGGRRGGSRAPTPLVGRGEELDILTRRWERARRGEGQLVLITGEPGLGKSRLIEEFRARLAETPHTWVEWASSQLLQNTPLHPIAEWGRARFGGADVAGERQYAELETALASVGLDAGEYAPLLAPVIDAPTPPGRAPNLSPEELRSRQLAALASWVLASARTQPIVLAFEDLHWADPTSLDVLQALAERGAQASLLILATTRPEFRPAWKQRSHHGVISLAPLDAGEVVRMVGEIATRHALSKDVIAGVSERSGGVPLFIEEVTRLLLERGEAGGVQAIPPTLQQSLAARLDRLGSAREIAQIGAVLGRSFSYALLKSVAAVDDRGQTGVSDPGHSFLDAALEKLADAELLFVEGVAPHANYRFKHALIQDAAYDSLLKSRRQTLHRRVAELLLASPAPEAEALAHHFTLGGQTELAIEWWGKAGDQALRRSAFAEAISHLGKAIEMADKVGGGATKQARVAPTSPEIRAKYAQALMITEGYTSQKTETAYRRVESSGQGAVTASEQWSKLFGLWTQSVFKGDISASLEAGEAQRRLGESENSPTIAAAAHRQIATSLFMTGAFKQARDHAERASQLYDEATAETYRAKTGADFRVVLDIYLALMLWATGEIESAEQLMEGSVRRAREVDPKWSFVVAASTAVMLLGFARRAEDALPLADEALEVATANSIGAWEPHIRLYRCWAYGRLNDPLAGSRDVRSVLKSMQDRGIRLYGPMALALMADLECAAGATDEALERVAEGLDLATSIGAHVETTNFYRLRGVLLESRGAAGAEEAYREAIRIAREQGARTFELQAALSLAKLYQSTARPIDAHDMLGPALQGFSPTPEFPQIAEAKALFEALAEKDEVKAASASLNRRLRLQVAYGNALISARGFSAPETRAAFERARALSGNTGDASAGYSASYGLWVSSFVRGELASMQEAANAFMHATSTNPLSPEAGVAHRVIGATHWFAGDFVTARGHLEQALAIFDPIRDADLAFVFSQDVGVSAKTFLALTFWPLGETDMARGQADEMIARADQSGHVPTMVYGHLHKALFELMAHKSARAVPHIETLGRLARDNEMPMYVLYGEVLGAWANGYRSRPESVGNEMRGKINRWREQVGLLYNPLLTALLAEIETASGEIDAALVTIDQAIVVSERTGQRWFDAGLHRIRGEILVKQNPAAPAPAEAAFLAAIAVAGQQKARSFELRAALSLARLYQSTGRPIDAHDLLGPALEGFSPTPEFPQIVEAKALLEALAADEGVKTDAARRSQRLKLHTTYGQAVMWSKGYAAEETKAALARVGELATKVRNSEAPLDAYFGRWVQSLWRGEFGSAREAAESFLCEAEREMRLTEAGVAHRMLGVTLLNEGDFEQAGAHFEQALRIYDPDRDREARFRYSLDSAVVATACLAIVTWCVGDFARARALMDEAVARAVESAHAPTLANAYYNKGALEILRDDAEATRRAAEVMVALGREHGLPLYLTWGALPLAWARAKLGDRDAGPAEFREALAEYASQGNKLRLPFYRGLLAGIEAEGGDVEAARAGIDGALALAGETGDHWYDAELHRIRGQILLKQTAADPAPAEAAFLTALAIAQSQKARSFELLAALSLAKLYQSTNRAIDAHDILGPALEGFSPTPEFPAIAEAKALLAALATNDEVKAAGAARQRRLRLQVSYGQAVMWSKGFAAEETKAAFARVGELAAEAGNGEAPLEAYYARWGQNLWRGDYGSARESGESFLRETAGAGRETEACAAHRFLGSTLLWQGDFEGAQGHLEQTLRIYDSERDREAKFRFGPDSKVAATSYLALAAWCIGDVGRAGERMDEAGARAAESAHAPTIANTYILKAIFETLHGAPEAARRAAEAIVALGREHGLALYSAYGALPLSWARAKLGDRDAGPAELRQALAGYADQGNKFLLPFYLGLFAEIEAGRGDVEAALAGIDGALALAGETGEHWTDAALHRIRGEILLKQNPADTAAAEAAFLTAIEIARAQKARSFELLAALSLAKLYQSTNRAIDAHNILGPALEGFSQTPEFPGIAEAQALLAALAEAEEVKASIDARKLRLK